MPARFYRPKPPGLPRAKVPDAVLIVFGALATVAVALVTMRLPWVPTPPLVLVLVPAYALYAADQVLTIRSTKFADELYEFLNDVGDMVSSGFGVEQALQTVCERRGGPVAKEFQRALALAEDRPLDVALIDAAVELGDDTFTETAELLSMMVQSDGEVGLAIKNLGRRLTRARKAERGNERALVGGVALLLIFGGFIGPALGSFLSAVSEYPLFDWAYRFYAIVAFANGAVQFTVFGSVRRMLARMPSYAISTYATLLATQYIGGKLTFEELGLL